MKVSIKNLSATMEENSKGIDFEVNDKQDKSIGHMTVNKSGLVWCREKSTIKAKVSWKDLIEWMESNSI